MDRGNFPILDIAKIMYRNVVNIWKHVEYKIELEHIASSLHTHPSLWAL